MSQTLAKLLRTQSVAVPDTVAQMSKDPDGNFLPTTYGQLYSEVVETAAGLLEIGVRRETNVGLVSENRKEWLLVDLAVLSIGAVDVPRGNDTTPEELQYILQVSECSVVLVENGEQLAKVLSVKDQLPKLETLVFFENDQSHQEAKGPTIIAFSELRRRGQAAMESRKDEIESLIDRGEETDTATIIFTSGTTGRPKGVMLSHRNFLHQVEHVPELIHVGQGDIWLCVLPVWHSFERIMQYVSIGSASALAYSKPIGRIMLADFATVRPTWMASVPRIWESIQAGIYRNVKAGSAVKRGLFNFFVAVGGTHAYLRDAIRGCLPAFRPRFRVGEIVAAVIPYLLLSPLKALGNVLVFKKIKARLGGRFVAGISGGGALPESVDNFFQAAGILLLEGYGLTETAPVLGVRDQSHPVRGTVGPVFPGTEICIVDDEGNTLPPGNKGVVLAKGPQVMKGYYKDPELTATAIDQDGRLNTGDLGMLTVHNELKIVGRAKDTIVLRGGENVEPAPIEKRLELNPLVSNAIVVGQDQRYLGALIVPDFEALEETAKRHTIDYETHSDLIENPEVRKLYGDLVSDEISAKNGFRNFERVFKFDILPSSFELGKELSAKQEIKRHRIYELHKERIDRLFEG